MGVDAAGKVATNSLVEHVRQSILLILRTDRGERMMAPDFGAGLSDFAFQPTNNVTMQVVKKRVTDSLTRYEPRIQVVSVDVSPDPERGNVLLIGVRYYIRQVDTMFNLVYPFYLDRGQL